MVWLTAPFSARKPLTREVFLKEIIPLLLLYYISALLVLIRGTHKIRLALLPVTLWLAFRIATRLDIASGFVDPRFAYLNQGLVLAMSTLGMRALIWACRLEPYVRYGSQKSQNGNIPTKWLDALDLCFNLRGCGWNWSSGLYVPKETRPLSRAAFTLSTLFTLLVEAVIFDCLHLYVQFFDPNIGLAIGGSIYDNSLSPVPRYLRSSIICFVAGLTIYMALQVFYHLGTLVGILVLQQHPSQWPPLFEYPWRANSLSEFWAKCWHQVFRQCFISLGYEPMHYVGGRAGGVMGAFLISAFLHHFGLQGMSGEEEFWTVGTFFIMMGIGVVLEGVWKGLTGYRVDGILGKAWTMGWLIAWGHLLIEAYCRRGVVASIFFPDEYRPSIVLLRLVHYI